MALTPQHAHQANFGVESYATHPAPFGKSPSAQPCAIPSTMPAGNLRFAGRKRSRGEAAPNLATDEPEPQLDPGESREQWELSPGMVLIKKGGYVADACSQSGTWVKKQAGLDNTSKAKAAVIRLHEQQQRPSLRSNKSQRLSRTDLHIPQRCMSPTIVSTSETFSLENSLQPVLNQFTLHLGVGWSFISEDQHIQAAARGWVRYIENHYSVSSAAIRLESKSLQSYLVEATEGFFLFSEDLRQCRLVSKNAERAMRNLMCSPPLFESSEILFATEIPHENESNHMMFPTETDSMEI